jgi:hypothetical protein
MCLETTTCNLSRCQQDSLFETKNMHTKHWSMAMGTKWQIQAPLKFEGEGHSRYFLG